MDGRQVLQTKVQFSSTSISWAFALALVVVLVTLGFRGERKLLRIGSDVREVLASFKDELYPSPENDPLAIPRVGSYSLRILSTNVLELMLVTTQSRINLKSRRNLWDFVKTDGTFGLPPTAFLVLVNGSENKVLRIGFKRRALYAPAAKRDLRIGNFLYLELEKPIPEKARVQVVNPDTSLWSRKISFESVAAAGRWSPVIHLNQVGYSPKLPKKAIVGYYLGSLGELSLAQGHEFRVIRAGTAETVFEGNLSLRKDEGFPFTNRPYQQVFEADFSLLSSPGTYQLFVPGLGTSFAFQIDDGVPAAFARSYALGLYHQRCGVEKILPFTRFVHGPCHIRLGEIPTSRLKNLEKHLAILSAPYRENPRHSALRLDRMNASLFPFTRQGKVDLQGGHHDAGDYSKYTVNSAQLIHHLIFAVDAFPGVVALDNLGLPESGDGKSDLLQIAKWEADFLVKMQDRDGGFSTIVYPRDRMYEIDVLPDRGDTQVVLPKNTVATAAAVAALAQASTSPKFRETFPSKAILYFEKAKKGWAFLERAFSQHPGDSAYQTLSQYGDAFIDDDEIVWARTEIYLATGDEAMHKQLLKDFDPESRETHLWTWVRLPEAFGCAIRSYAFATRTGRAKLGNLDPTHLEKCNRELLAAAGDFVSFAAQNAYGTSFPIETKKFRTAAWFFSGERAFDLAVAYQLEPKVEFLDCMISNLNFEAGTNPNNVCFLTGLGWRRQHEIVHQYAQNDRRRLPPSGLPIGSIQEGFQFLPRYGKQLFDLTFPPDWTGDSPYFFYDRWGDSFNAALESTSLCIARSLAAASFLMAQSPIREQRWRSAEAQILGVPERIPLDAQIKAELVVSGLDTTDAVVVWETSHEEPTIGSTFTFCTKAVGPKWIEAEAQWPDGRRAFAAREFQVV